MGLEIIPVGGFKEIGRNCVFIKVDDDVIVLDMGLNMEQYIKYSETDDFEYDMSPDALIKHHAIPNINKFRHLIPKIRAICISHAHLDHLGAIPYILDDIRVPIHGTPYAIEVLRETIFDKRRNARVKLVSHKSNSIFKVTDSINVEFIHVTHSTPQAVVIAVHTKYGVVVYANDFKFDNNPILGAKPNFKRLRELEGSVRMLIMDSLYSTYDMKMPSEMIARELLKDVLLGTESEGKNIIVTTFSSQIARLKSIAEIGAKMNRRVVFLGRSLAKYVIAAEKTGIADFRDVELVKYGDKIRKRLSEIKNPERYLFVVTGNQGEPKAVLARMISEKMFNFRPGDHVVFSCKTIPVQITIENREKIEHALKSRHVRIFKDIHVSGHGAKEDLRDMINILKPEHIIPTHGELNMLNELRDLALEMGYDKKNIHVVGNGEAVNL